MAEPTQTTRRWTLHENARGDLLVDGPHLDKTPGPDGIGGVIPVDVVSVAEVERLLSEVSSDFAGAHVNAGVVVGAVRRRLRDRG